MNPMTGNNRSDSSITVRQAKAIPEIVRARSIEEGCRKARVSKASYYAWCKDPAFTREFRRQRDVLIDEAMENLKASVREAVGAVVGLLHSDNESIRRAASNDVLNFTLKIKELQDFEARLESIERALEDKTNQTFDRGGRNNG